MSKFVAARLVRVALIAAAVPMAATAGTNATTFRAVLYAETAVPVTAIGRGDYITDNRDYLRRQVAMAQPGARQQRRILITGYIPAEMMAEDRAAATRDRF